jgi:hypothetical protein
LYRNDIFENSVRGNMEKRMQQEPPTNILSDKSGVLGVHILLPLVVLQIILIPIGQNRSIGMAREREGG